ncbi:MAG: PAS domain S-box protein [Gemmatimonadaceae bacterium]
MTELPDTPGPLSDGSSEPKARILLVDDDPANLLSLRMILEDLGQNLVEVRSGEEAVQQVQSGEFAVVLLDVLMPGIGGFETAKAIRGNKRSQYTPIIFLTASDVDRPQMAEGYMLGAVDFLVKPLMPVILQAKVRNFVQLFQEKQRAKQEAEQLRLLVHGTAEYAIFMLDAKGIVLTWNSGAERLTGYQADEIIGQHFSRFYPSDAIETGWPAHELNVAAAEGRFEDEGWRIRKDGSRFWANVVITALHDEAGSLRGFSKITRDMTERKRAEENARCLVEETTARRAAEDSARLIQEQRERLHVTLASIGDAVITTDAEGRVTFVNAVAENLTGWKVEEASLRNLDDVFRIINEETRHPVESPVVRALKEGVIVGLANHTMLISKDGTERPIDDSAAPIRDATGSVIGCVLVFRDVTESRRAAQEIRIGEARKSAILDSALDCIITMDHEGKVVEFNTAAEKTFGYSRCEVVGRELADLIIPPSLRERHHRGMAHYLATGEGPVLGKRLEVPALRADGTEFPVELAITRIPTDGPPMFTAYLRDISESKRAEQHRNARLAVTHVLSETASVEDGASGVLQAVCEKLGWDVGFFWTVNDAGTALACMKSWHRPEAAMEEFETTSCSRTFERGEGLPGRVWASGKPAWMQDVMQDGNFPRLASAAKHDLQSAFGCPIVVGDRTLGVLEFFTQRLREPDTDLLEMMATVAGNVGQFLERKSAEEKVRQSERELADFFDNATVGLQWVGSDGTILRVNRAELEMLGFREDEYVGHPVAEFHADEDVICDILQRLQAGEKLDEYPARLRCKDGSIKDVLIDSSVLWTDEKFAHTRCFTRDVTERKRAEEALRESEQRFARFMHHLPGLAWIKDVEGRYVYANDAAEKAFRTPRQVLYGKPDEEVFPPETAAQFKHNDRQAMLSGTGIQAVECLEREDGVLRYSLVSKFPILGSKGRVALVGGMAIDITEQRRVEQALRESEERFRGLMEQAPFSIQVFSPDGRTLRVNRAWEELWGVRFEQIEGYNILEDRQLEARGVLGHIREGFAGQTALIPAIQFNPNETIPGITQQEDPRRWLSAVIYPLKDTEGQIREVVLIHEDITARKCAEDALLAAHRELESRVDERTVELVRGREFLQALLENVQTGVVACDAEGVLTLFNGVTRALHGLPKESIPPEQWAERYRLYRTDGQTPMAKEDVPLYRALQGEWVQDAEMVIAPLGVPPRTVQASGQAFHDAQGTKLGAVVSMQDITARKQAESELRQAHDELERRIEERTEQLGRANAALRESEEKLRLLADTIPQLAWMARTDGHIFWYNRRWYEYTGTMPEQMEGWGWQTVHDPDVLPKVLERWQGSIASGEPFDMVFPLKGADDTFRPFLTRVNPLRDEEGRILYWFGTNTDISDIKRMEQALRDADRRKDEFLATLAHELRNPLAPIRNSLQILKMPRVDAATVQQTTDMMERQVHHLVRLVDDLLDVSRVMRGKIELRREAVEVATIIARAVETTKPLIEVQHHRLDISVPTESLLLDADPVRLTQVVDNLLTNAAKYTEANGHLWLMARRDGDEAVLSVRDNGIGIAQDMLPHIFELFVQVDHASTKAQGGLGIGLTLVKNLVEMHNGSVEARSRGLGEGCEILIRLPLSAQRIDEDHGRELGRQLQQPPPSGYRLLVVDDNQDAANSLAMLLKLQGHEVRVAFSGVAALEIANTYTPDVVFLDIGMPGMDGYDVARLLRQQPGLEHLVLAALTGWGQREDRRRTAEAGFNHHLVKPVEPKALEAVLAELDRPDVQQTDE